MASRAEALHLIPAKGNQTQLSKSASIVQNWHNENHSGAFRFCQEQPCRAVVEVRGS